MQLARSGTERHNESGGGSHAGNVPNQTAAPDGAMLVEVFTPHLRLAEGNSAVLDADVPAIFIQLRMNTEVSHPAHLAHESPAVSLNKAET